MKNKLIVAAIGLLCVSGLSSCSNKEKESDVVSPRKVIFNLTVGDNINVPQDSIQAVQRAQITGNCSFPQLYQDGQQVGGRAYYISGQKGYFKTNAILTLGCNSLTTCDVVLLKNNAVVQILSKQYQPDFSQTTSFSLDSNLPTGTDYSVVFVFNDGSGSLSRNPITIYGSNTNITNVSPSGLNFRTIKDSRNLAKVTWDINPFPQNDILDIYVYGLDDFSRTRSKLGSVVNSQGSFTFTLPSSSFFTSKWALRVQKASNDLEGSNSSGNTSSYFVGGPYGDE